MVGWIQVWVFALFFGLALPGQPKKQNKKTNMLRSFKNKCTYNKNDAPLKKQWTHLQTNIDAPLKQQCRASNKTVDAPINKQHCLFRGASTFVLEVPRFF